MEEMKKYADDEDVILAIYLLAYQISLMGWDVGTILRGLKHGFIGINIEVLKIISGNVKEKSFPEINKLLHKSFPAIDQLTQEYKEWKKRYDIYLIASKGIKEEDLF